MGDFIRWADGQCATRTLRALVRTYLRYGSRHRRRCYSALVTTFKAVLKVSASTTRAAVYPIFAYR